MIDILDTLAQWLEQGTDAALAVICAQDGSTPREAGACMAVKHDGTIAGTIGGGIVEAQGITACRELLRKDIRSEVQTFDLTNSQAAQAGMICGGKLKVRLFSFKAASPADARCLRAAQATLREGVGATALIGLDGQAPDIFLTAETPGPWEPCAPPAELARALNEQVTPNDSGESGAPHEFAAPDGSWFVLPLPVPLTAVVAGAGHVGLFTASVLAMAGFRTVVLDDRADFANAARFPEAAKILVTDGFDHCLDQAGVNASTFIVILTRGHVHDKTVLAQALRTPAAYIGMIGSRKKRDATYAALLDEGFTQADIDRVHCPIGLDIHAETPEEIAVAIAGEIIKVRRGG